METKKIKSRTTLLIYILIILGLLMVVNYGATKMFSRIDLTEGKQYTMAPASKKYLKKLDDIITIKVFASKNLPSQAQPMVTNVKDLLAEYKTYGGKKIRISWVDPADDEKIKQEASSFGIEPSQVNTIEKDKQQMISCYFDIAILFADKIEKLRFSQIQNLQNLEYNLTHAIMSVERQTTPKIGILKVDTLPEMPPQFRMQQQKDPAATEVKFAPLFELLRQTYEVVKVDLSTGTPIDSSIKTLVIPGGSRYTDRMIYEIDQFFMKGGKLIVLAEGMRVSFQYYGPMAEPVDTKLLELLNSYGVKVEQNMVLDASCGQVQIPQKVGPFTMNVAVPYPYFVRLGRDEFNQTNPAVAPLYDVILPWTSTLTLLVDQTSGNEKGKQASTTSVQSGVKAEILAHSSKKSWTANGSIDLNPQQKWEPPAKTDKQFPLAVHLSGAFNSYFSGKPVPSANPFAPSDPMGSIQLQTGGDDPSRTTKNTSGTNHLIVVANSDFVSAQNGAPSNITMVQNLVDWLTLDDNLIQIRTRAVKDRSINSDMLKSGSRMPGIIRLINIIAMPLFVIIIGILIFMRRREHITAASPTPNTLGPSGEKSEGN